MNQKLTQLRRDLQREADKMQRKVLKGIRWLLLKHPEHLDESKSERARLQDALELNQSLATDYYLKEDLSQLWQQSSKAVAGRFLTDWCARDRASGIKVLQTMANTLQGHRSGILNWYDYPISSGPLEGINNKIGALRRMAYGAWPTATETRTTSSPNSTPSTSPGSHSSGKHNFLTRARHFAQSLIAMAKQEAMNPQPN